MSAETTQSPASTTVASGGENGKGATRLVITGSIATDHLATFPGRFADQLIPDQLAHVSLSFLVDNLEVRRGGAAANIAFGLGSLGLRPFLVGAVGDDFEEYELWLKAHGVQTEYIHVSHTLQTARFMCTTDADQNQIASFYAGAMAEAARTDLVEVIRRAGGADLILISPNAPDAMLRHTGQCRAAGVPFAADPSQQLARLERHEVHQLVDGARLLFTNEYEAAMLLERAAWTREEVLARVGTWITTRGGEGVRVESRNAPARDFPALAATEIADPTGAGDAFRAGFLAALGWNLPYSAAVPMGCAMATLALEAVGSQQYAPTPADLIPRLTSAYGPTISHLLSPHLGGGA